MTSTASTTTPVKHAFLGRVEAAKSPKSDINALIFDYLAMEGYPNAAAKFSKEANLRPQQVDDTIRTRQEIQHAIHQGHIHVAISTLNDLDSEILDQDAALHFALLRLQLVELIRHCMATPGSDISPALTFATTQLGPRAPTDPNFLQDLEETMALLVLPHDALEPKLADILSPNLRRQVADAVNKAVLRRQSQRREAAIRQLIKVRAWAEVSARSTSKYLPDRFDLGLRKEDVENGHDAMLIS